MADKKYSGKKQSAEELALGRIAPQAPELEEAVLGAIILEQNAYSIVSEILKPESFYREEHQEIYKAITNLFMKQQPIDLLTVVEELKKEGKLKQVGGIHYISELTRKVASAGHIEYHARIIWQKYLQREIIRISSELQAKSYDEAIDVNDLLEEAENSFFSLSQGQMKREVVQINPVIEEAIERIREAGNNKEKLSGVPSGFTDLDRITSGWQRSDLIIIAARPAMGKTAFVLSMARNMAVDFGKSVAIFSLEMSNVQLVNRLIVSETELSSEQIKNGRLSEQEWKQLDSKITTLVDAPIYIDDTAGLSVFELRAKCRRLKSKHDIDIVIIDYLQLMNASGMNPGSREQEVSLISRSLKGLAKELDIPIIALSQLNRGVESRTGDAKRPQLADLRESGAIEQDADMVLFIHRPEYYKITEDAEGNSLLGIAEIIIAKHRNGATGDVYLRFRQHLARFQNIDDIFEDDPTGGFHHSVSEGVDEITIKSKMNGGTGALPEFNDNSDLLGEEHSAPPF
ncbi:MAG: replicative DNA helicase [Chlorobi bacterium]|nr:replicative DNA helicase [Chlorobiota bacterium]